MKFCEIFMKITFKLTLKVKSHYVNELSLLIAMLMCDLFLVL